MAEALLVNLQRTGTLRIEKDVCDAPGDCAAVDRTTFEARIVSTGDTPAWESTVQIGEGAPATIALPVGRGSWLSLI